MQYLLLSFFVSLIVIVLILKTSIANIALDTPNQRSLHTKLTPRTGGVAIMSAVLITWILVASGWQWILFVFSLMLIFLMDDIFHLSIKWRLLIQLLASFLMVIMMLPPQGWWLTILLTLLITWMTNLYNFMDGSDGLAGGMGLFGFASYAMGAFAMGDMNIAMMTAVIAVACLAFLAFNFYPAKIFMGDSGSIPLGFLAGSIGVYGYFNSLWPAWFPILVFSPFVVDATATLIRRQIYGEKIWQAHRSHYYQRLVQMGWGHRKTALAEYVLMMGVSITGLLMIQQTKFFAFAGLVFWVVIYLIIMHCVDRQWVKANK